MMGVTFTKAQRERAKKDGAKLCAIYTPHVSIDGPCTQEEHDDIVRFLHAFLKRRFDKRKAEREAALHGEQVKGTVDETNTNS